MSRRKWRGNIALERAKFFLLVLDPAPYIRRMLQRLRSSRGRPLNAPVNWPRLGARAEA
jgi:hypothetical protein